MARTIIDDTHFVKAVTNRYYPEGDTETEFEYYEEFTGYVFSLLHERGSDKSNIFDSDSRACQRKISWRIDRELYFERNGEREVVETKAEFAKDELVRLGINPKNVANAVDAFLKGTGDPCTEQDKILHSNGVVRAIELVADLMNQIDQEGLTPFSVDEILRKFSEKTGKPVKPIIDRFANGPYRDENGVWHIVP